MRNDFRSEGAAPYEKWPKKEHKTISDEIKVFFFWGSLLAMLQYIQPSISVPLPFHSSIFFFFGFFFFSVDVNEIECVLGWFHRFNGDIAGLHFFIRPQ